MEEEFREFVAARSAALLRTAYLLAGDWATAEDLLQTALTKTYLAWKRLGEIEAVEPYARRVLVNTATSWWRRKWHGERPTETLPERAEPDRLEEQLDRDALWQHVKALPARQRAVLVLRFYEDLSEAQTAALLGISVGTVKSQTSRALGSLRHRLTGEGLEPSVRRADPTASAAREAPARSAVQPAAVRAETVPEESVPAPSDDAAVAEPAGGASATAAGGQTVVSPRPPGGIPAGLPTALPAPAVGLEG
jgi:RNA polymerase sigma-70 factor (sigma-E family)